jgi:periplasmic divalent cation tolerance protein
LDDPILILSTASSREEAKRIAKCLVEEKLAACVQMVPGLESVYIWQGKLYDEPEFLLLIKSRAYLFSRVAERVLSLHTYDVPEIVALRIAEGSKPYMDWMESSIKQDDSE